MKPAFYTLSVLLLCSAFSFAKGGPRDTLGLRPAEGPRDNPQLITVTKARLIRLVDSLLDLENIDINEIELVNYYNLLLNSRMDRIEISRDNLLPASAFYDDFDETTVFQVTPELELPENQTLLLQNDSLGEYHHPRIGPINSKFGWRDNRMHKGIDINLHKGDAVVAAFDGMVRIARNKGGFGNVVIIRHYNGLETVYAHLSRIKVKQGQIVSGGQLVGLGGSTGHSSGPHLHFELRFKGHALNPSTIISFTDNKLLCDSITVKRSKYGVCAYPSNATLHTVERGDSWYEIAKQYGLSMKELCLLNGTDKRYYLKIGQKLRVN